MAMKENDYETLVTLLRSTCGVAEDEPRSQRLKQGLTDDLTKFGKDIISTGCPTSLGQIARRLKTYDHDCMFYQWHANRPELAYISGPNCISVSTIESDSTGSQDRAKRPWLVSSGCPTF